MKTPKDYESENVNDLRDGNDSAYSASSSGIGGGAGANIIASILPLMFKSKKGRIIAIILVVVMLFSGSKFGGLFSSVANGQGIPGISGSQNSLDTPDNNDLTKNPAPNDAPAIFVSYVLDDVNNFWNESFTNANKSYSPSDLNIFDGNVQSGCGVASSQVGPFYCPRDSNTYLDLTFFEELQTRFGAAGDFAQAYVIAHEIGHHVQNELGISDAAKKYARDNESDNSISVRVELQADCFAGVWAHSANERGLLDAGDIDEALNAAAQIGDDSIQSKAGLNVDHEAFTHGSSAQREKWLRLGYESGDSAKCDTFKKDKV